MALGVYNRSAVFRRSFRSAFGGGGVSAFFKYTAGDSLASWTTSRASSATYYDINGVVQTATTNTMRDGHYLGGVRHWLLEPARTNSTLQSSDLTQAVWTKSLCTIGGSITTPDGAAAVTTVGIIGTNAVNTLVDGTLNVVTATGYTVTASTNQAYSVFAKPGNKSQLIIQSKDNAGAFHTSWVNVTTGAVGTTDASHTIKTWSVSQSFYRVEVRLTSSGAGAGANLFAFGFTDADNSRTLTGDGATVNGYVWGAQYESDQPWPSSYIATAAASVTRSADASPTRAHGSTPQPRALYVDMTIVDYFAGAGDSADYFAIGGVAGANEQYVRSANAHVRAQMNNNAVFVAGDTTVSLNTIGARAELRAASATDTTITGGVSINGGAETTGTSAASAAFQGAYATANYSLADTLIRPIAIRAVKDVLGSGVTLATCRAA